MDLGLARKRIIVTGATRGIGRAIAECFAREGANVAICARTGHDIKDTVASLRRHGVVATGRAVDVGDREQFQLWIKDACRELDGIDVFVSNVSGQSFDWDRSFAIDIRACVNGVEAALPFLEKSDSGAIVAVASQAALLSVPSYKPYAAMKAALISYMSSLSRELAPKKIRVNAVSPGEIYFGGGFWHRMKLEDPALYHKVLEKNISGRLGTPEEVARAVVFLASPAASFISGANLLVDFASREHVQF